MKYLESCYGSSIFTKEQSFTLRFILNSCFSILDEVVCILTADNKLFCHIKLFMPHNHDNCLIKITLC